MRLGLIGCVLAVLSSVALAAPPWLGDCGAVLKPDGSIDIASTIAAIKSMRMNTFAYLIHESPTAWQQLPSFAEAAEREGIEVWVYLVPWSAVPPVKKNKPPCEPFGTDFVRWAEEIARISRRHPNVTTILLDDFAINDAPGRFTPRMIDDMRRAAAAHNPRLKLLALLYFNTAWPRFVERYGERFDGAVVCYPQSQAEVDNALNYLAGEAHGASVMAEMTKHNVGERATVTMRAEIRGGRKARLRFLFGHARISAADGEHTAFVRVNGKTVWEDRVDGRGRTELVNLELPDSRDELKIELGFTGQRRGDESECFIRFDDVTILGRAQQPKWKLSNPGKVRATLGQSGDGNGRRMTTYLMPATDPAQFAKRYDVPVTADAILAKLQLCLDNLGRDRTAGVINFYTPKDDQSTVHREVARRFESLR